MGVLLQHLVEDVSHDFHSLLFLREIGRGQSWVPLKVDPLNSVLN